MRFGKSIVVGCALLMVAGSSASAAPRMRRGPTSPRLFKPRAAPARPKAIAHIDDERATQIQAALVKSGYLTGEPTGTWDATSQAAMAKLQSDNGWQSKLVPDARALNKLGLGSGSVPASDIAGATNPDTPEAAATTEGVPAK